ncbi:putative leucine-rich repeat receptor-like serine/threonine-protein kinase [Camellia lanceoleosa]|uniref:Leucine-rich repeat receptor-like serine/threonine-protein kinase n=1 Tax=Camellia lanceoleosa TaxID=1840588 RepID=A0ACC0I2Q8_9ERIC|nr:putative leucine-rich repeat receptor-like serine/threonine-protein kinase [Camellia lanceoleosa]
MVFNRSKFLLLLQYLVIISEHALFGHHHPFRHSIQTDRAALLAFKRSISSNPYSVLSNWNEVTQVCNFTGVRCNTKHHCVTKLILHNAELLGKLSPFIANLTRLRFLQLVNNNISGIIPSEFSSLQHLSSLWLEGNNLEGQIPDSFSLLTNLAFEIPTEIRNCPGLLSLALYNNQFTGEIPFSITNASLMFNLDAENNHLKGELPSEIVANLPELLYLHLSYNDMVSHDNNSNLVSFFTALKNCTILDELELASMDLGGRLPSSIGQLFGNLTSLLLQENRIAGSIPPTLLVNNNFSGIIPPEFSSLQHLSSLWLEGNNLEGQIPDFFSHLTKLASVNLQANKLTGKIPASFFSNCTMLKNVDLSMNFLTAEIPTEIGNCPGLWFLALYNNQFTSEIPFSITNASLMCNLDVENNHLKGELPSEIVANLPELLYLHSSYNDMVSHDNNANLVPFFTALKNCTILDKLELAGMDLGGRLPSSIDQLVGSLTSLLLQENRIAGSIPPTLVNLTQLTVLNLTYNFLSGTIPAEIS